MRAFPENALFLIAGPCVVESDALNVRVAEHLARLSERLPGGVIYKASFDKANRSNVDAARGPGIDEGLRALEHVKRETGLRILTDVHLPEQCAPAAEVVDVLQIPAFLCRQTDLLEAAGATGKPVNVKKGQWMHPEGMRGAVEKVRRAATRPATFSVAGHHATDDQSDLRGAAAEVAVTERGTFFGYGDLVVDMRSFSRLRELCEAPVIFDGTHSVQQPGRGEGGSSGGMRQHIAALTVAAVAAGANGLFLETHPTPDIAPSDGPNMLPLRDLDAVVNRALEVWTVVNT
ncbi:MAG TPA: 3-deoxy-8-phosphooctulonate synthase [Gemmatimonadaceae bacterium]|nr:3-deoxy-8-phosphooctulonate synthase [Gemmatimonadaceae bacterium]